eukprot:459232-Amphidinium_carterae.1
MVFPEAPFQLTQHLRVVRHADFLQCLDCTRQTGKVKGKYNFAYLTRQLQDVKEKRRTGIGKLARFGGEPVNQAPPPGIHRTVSP